MKYLIMLLLSISATSQAAWECKVACDKSVTTEISHILRQTGGNEYSDWAAECKNAGGVSNWPGGSNCSYVYCTKYQSYTQMQSGSGTTLTQARENARAGCYNVPTGGCGGGNSSGWVREPYDCRELGSFTQSTQHVTCGQSSLKLSCGSACEASARNCRARGKTPQNFVKCELQISANRTQFFAGGFDCL
jgi:hypothetical protein